MAAWFESNFEDPVQQTPHEKQEVGHQFVWGGPYSALAKITEAFPDADEEEVSEAVGQVEAKGTTRWAIAQARIVDENEVVSEPAAIIRTPRFKNGISLRALSDFPERLKKETMLLWFLDRCEPAIVGGTAYGFGAYGRGAYFQGYLPQQLIGGLFAGTASAQSIEDVAAMFEGFWVPKTLEPKVNSYLTDGESRLALDSALADFALVLKKIAFPMPAHARIGDNGGPPLDELPPSVDAPITSTESVVALRAVQDMRLAITVSAEPSVLDTLWEGIAPVVAKFGRWALGQAKLLVEEARPIAAKAIGERIPDLVVAAVGYFAGMHVSDLVELLLIKRRGPSNDGEP